MKTDSAIVATDDRDRLAQLVRALGHSSSIDRQQLELLDEVLQNADIMAPEHVPVDVIRMNSRFRVLDFNSGRRLRYTLVFPENADISKDQISILAPVGTALLGHRQGDVVEVKVPGGSRKLRIKRVLHMPAGRKKGVHAGQPIGVRRRRAGIFS